MNIRKAATSIMAALLACGISAPSGATTLKQSGFPNINITTRVFTGGIYLSGDSSNFSGALEANNPKCDLTVPSNSNGVSEGVGPNGSILLNGSAECAGSYELFLSGGATQFALPSATAVGSSTGVYSGTFAIISASDQQTVEWAGTYVQVFNISPTNFGCSGVDFCANLGPTFGSETFNGGGLSYLLELNGFTWFVPQHK
jgi:hypothetical protein